MRVHELYSTPIAIVDNVYHNPVEIAQRAQQLVRSRNSRPSDWYCTINTTHHYDQHVERDPIIKPAVDAIQVHLNAYTQKVWGNDCRIVGCWANEANSGEYQEQHHHIGKAMVHVAAVYYPQIDPNAKEILIFAPPFPLYDMFSTTRETVNLWTNRLVMFPGYLEHYFVPKQRDINKISIAFNCVLV